MKKSIIASLSSLAFVVGAGMAPAHADGHAVSACLITKTDTNPFFVKMKEAKQHVSSIWKIDLRLTLDIPLLEHWLPVLILQQLVTQLVQ